MQSRYQHELQTAATDPDVLAEETELGILRNIFRLLPAGVTVQDEHGRFLLVNDAAAVQLGVAAGDPAPASLEASQRREIGLELLRSGRALVAEESVAKGEAKQVFLTAHRPVR